MAAVSILASATQDASVAGGKGLPTSPIVLLEVSTVTALSLCREAGPAASPDEAATVLIVIAEGAKHLRISPRSGSRQSRGRHGLAIAAVSCITAL